VKLKNINSNFILVKRMKKKLKEQYETDGSVPKKEPPHVDDIFSVLDGLDKQKVTNYVIKQVLKHKVQMLTF